MTRKSTAARQVIADETATRIGHAHGTVHEGLELQVVGNPLSHLRYAFKRHLACADNSLCPKFVPRTCGQGIRNACLGAHVQIDFGGDLAYEPRRAQIADDEGIDARIT